RAVVSEAADLVCEPRIVGRDCTRVSKSTQILGRVKAVSCRMTQCSGAPSAIARTLRLCGVLEHLQSVLVCDGTDRVHVSRQPAEPDALRRGNCRRPRSASCRRTPRIPPRMLPLPCRGYTTPTP